MTIQRSGDFALLARLLHLARRFWPHIAAYLALTLLATPIALLAPLPLKIAVDSVIGTEPLPRFIARWTGPGLSSHSMLVLAAALLLGIAVLAELQKLAATLLYTHTGEGLVLEFRSRLFRHLQRLSLLYHDRTQASDSAYRVLWDGTSIRHVALSGVTPFVSAGFTLVAMVYIIFRLDPQLAVVALLVAPVLYMLTRLFRQRLRDQWREVKNVEAEGLSVVQEVLGAIRVVKAFGQERREYGRFVQHSRKGATARVRATLAAHLFGISIALTTTVGTAAVLLIGVRHVQGGLLTLGELLVVMAYLAQLYSPLKTISRNVGGLQSHLASAERALALLNETPDVGDRADARRLQLAVGEFVIRNVSFGYKPASPVLRNVSIEIPAGCSVGIIGKTGAGKTTLISLLLRFYDPQEGKIFLDGVDLRDYRLADLRNQYAVVLQDPVLFSTTIGENIAYAKPGASSIEIEAAAKAANAHGFISELPSGYDSTVGERGVQLSGGERQRVALARAFLKDSPILILDEPTSAVDLEAESQIIEALGRLMRNRTTFVIAHRLSTLGGCDVILKVANGWVETIDRPATTTGVRSVAG